ncbi:MAG TPA: hypothetical protein VMI75_27470 [Polyangiaceae bacterium]|nr:hypothetical protein [Polyangiaceae bacterium]
MSATRLAEAIGALVSEEGYRQAAAQVASVMAREDGVANAVGTIRAVLSR